jgi:hypothetical protein
MQRNPFESNIKLPGGTTLKPPTGAIPDLQRVDQQYGALTTRLEAVGAEVDDRGPFEKLLNLRQKQGVMGNIFETLDRPGQAIKGAILGAQEGDIIGGAWQGLSGELDVRGAEFLKELGMISESGLENMGGVEKFVINMVVDRIFDPLRLIPKGTISGALSAVNKKLGSMIAGKSSAKEVYQTYTAKQLMQVSEDFSGQVQSLVDSGVSLEEAGNQVIQSWREKGLLLEDGSEYLNKIQLDKLDDAGKPILDAKGNKIKEVYDRSEHLKRLEAKYAAGKMGKAEAAEYSGFRQLLTKLDDTFGDNPNIRLVINKVSDRQDDIAVFFRTGTEDNGNWVKLFNIDAKHGVPVGQTVMMEVQDGAIQFGKNVQLDEQSKKILMDAFGDIELQIAPGTTLSDAFHDIVMKKYAGAAKQINFSRDLEPDDFNKISEVFKEVLENQGVDLYYIVTEKGDKFVRFSDMIGDLNFEKATAGIRSKEQFRIFMTFDELNIDKYDDAMNDVIEKIQGVMSVSEETVAPVREIGILTALSEGETLFRKPAQIAIDLKKGIGRLFNAGYDYDTKMTAALRRVDGETRQVIYHKNRTLMQMSEEALKKSPKGETILNELMETGARIEVDANGVRQVVVDVTNLDTKGLIGTITPSIKQGNLHHLPIYSGTDAKNVAFNLNTQFENATQIQNAFKIVEKNGQYFIGLDEVDYDTFTKVMKQADFMGGTINIGRKQLSQEYMDFFLENEDLVSKYNKNYTDLITIFDKELGPDNLPDFFKSTNGYSRHVLSKQGIDYLKSQRPLARSRFTREGLDLLTDRTYIGTAEDVNKGLAAYYNLDFDVFDTNATKSLADLLRVGVIKNQSHRVLELVLNESDKTGKPLFAVVENTAAGSLGNDYKYIDDFGSEFNKMMENLSPEAQEMFETYLVKQGFEKGKTAIALNKTAYNTLKRIDNAYVEIPEWLKGYDKMMSIWKGFTLFTPGFHINNFVGNMTNSYLVGMDMGSQAIYLPKAQAMLSQYNPILDKLEAAMSASGGTLEEAVKTLSDTDQDMFRRLYNFYNDGISMKMGGVRDLEPLRRTLEAGGTRNIGTEALRANFGLAEAADDLQRFALYNWAYDKELAKFTKQGLSATEAALKARDIASHTVMDTLFDYQQFTPFERDTMKRLVPFYTFMKNNVVFQIQNIVRNPQQYASLGRAYNSYIDDVAGLGDGDMPDYARDNMWIPLPTRIMRGDKESIAFLKTNLPPADFAQFVENPFNRGVNSIAMPLKLPIELGMGRDTFTGQPLRDFPGQVSRMEPDTGVLAGFRDEQGQIAPFGDPIAQKIMNDLGLRVPAKYIGIALDMADAAAGYKEPTDAFLDALQQLNVVNIKAKEEINLIQLYRDLERLRNARSRYEQELRGKLPTQRELGIGQAPPPLNFP